MPQSATSESPAPGSGPTFEEAYGELEALVQAMESDEMPLADLIDAYERGIRLHSLCQKRLEEAQGRIEIIRRRASGETVLEPFDDSGAGDADAATPPPASSSPSLRHNAELF